ncbi:uncharacterized protein LOC100371736 [Saccoglossus kowalevskii]|uniref:Uncharacterized protein LOC100371736 n=1 Tax=Saccoglossus kowalevskii TaxID=10224 RepID=A0ABM0GUQ0_SACKO|nr:PREDICTED: uncharacterized protein LOC100371736 [Saccoglossus kowalevskii]
MAEDRQVVNNRVETPENTDDKDLPISSSLEDFVTEHYEKQKEDGRFSDTEEIDEERTKNFFDKALAASRKMNKEVAKSEDKLRKLHNELGEDTFAAWRKEHAAEVGVKVPDKVMAHMDL